MLNSKFEKIIDFIVNYGTYIILCVIALFAYTLVLSNIYFNKGLQSAENALKTDTIVVNNTTIEYDTIKTIEPRPVYTVKTKTIRDTLHTTDTLKQLVEVEIPITSKTYQDSTYKAVVSGYCAKLDSIKVFNKVITNTNTVTITNKLVKKPLVTISPSVGYGYSINSRKFEPQIGITIGMPILTIYKSK